MNIHFLRLKIAQYFKRSFLIGSCFFSILSLPSDLMSDTWVVDANGDWDVGTNWDTNPSYPNAPGADATFTGSYTTDPLTVTLSAGPPDITITVGNVNFNPTNSYIINSGGNPLNSLVLDNGGGNANLNTGSNATINCPVVAQSYNVFLGGSPGAGSTTTFNNDIIGGGNITFSNNNYLTHPLTFSGFTTIDQGALYLTGGATVPTNNQFGLYTSGLLDISGITAPSLTVKAIDLNSNSTINIGSKELIFQALFLGSVLYGHVDGTTGSVTADGANVVFDSHYINTFSGGVSAKNGGSIYLRIDGNAGDPSGGVLLDNLSSLGLEGGLTTARTITVSNGSYLGGGPGDPITINGPISGTGDIYTASDLSLVGGFGNFVFAGDITITGAMQFASESAVLSGTNSFGGNISIFCPTFVSSVVNLGGAPALQLDGGILPYGSQPARLEFLTGFTTAIPVTLTGIFGNKPTIVVDSGTAIMTGNITAGGTSSGPVTLLKRGPSDLHLEGVNTYPGGTEIAEGSLFISNGGTLNSLGFVNLSSGTSVFDIASMTNPSLSIGNLLGVASSEVILGGKNLSAGSSTSSTYNGTISGLGSFTKKDTGTLTLTGTNTHSGGTFITDGGTLSVAGDSSLGNLASTVTINASTLQFTGSTSPSRPVTLLGTGTIDVSGGATAVSMSSVLSGGSLTKSGAGTLTLTSLNSYTGTTTVSQGALFLTGAGTAGGATSPLNLSASGAAFDMSGISSSSRTIGALSGVSGTNLNLGANNLTVNSALNTTFSGVIAGTLGSITKQGTGELNLTGVNTYTGGTTVSQGTLKLTGIGTAGSVTSSINLTGATAIFDIGDSTLSSVSLGSITGVPLSTIQLGANNLISNEASNTTYSGTIAGTLGSFTKQGSGTLTFDGSAKTYTGGTTISLGTLQMSTGNQMAGDVNNSAILDIEAIALETYAGKITGTGSLNVNNGGAAVGVAILSNAANNYSGSTNITQGTLRAGAVGALSPNSAFNIGNGVTAGVLDLNGFANSVASIADLPATPGSILLTGDLTLTGASLISTFNGTITGPSTLILNGVSSNLTLAGTNTCGAQINQGTLTGSVATLPSVIGIATPGDLTINQGVDATFTGTITGTGTIDKLGTGTLFFTAGPSNVSGFTGLYNATGGITKLNTLIGGDVTINSGATLSGTGTVGGNLLVKNGGTIAPGNSIGTMNVLGNYTQAPNTIYLVEIDGAGNSTHIHVTGTVTLNGGVVTINSNDGILTSNIPYTIVHADGGLSGTFTSASAQGFAGGAVGIPLLSYTATDALFMFASKSKFPVGTTPNQKAVAKQFGTLTSPTSDESDVLINLIGLSQTEQDRALDAMSGEQYTNYLQMTEVSSRQFIRRMYDPIQSIVTGQVNLDCNSSCGCTDLTAFWMEGGATRSRFKGNMNAEGYKTNGIELAGGFQALVAEDVVVGFAGGYSKDQVHFDQYASGRNLNSYGGVYALYRPKSFYVFADAAYTYSSNRLSRKIQFGGIDRVAKGRPKISETTFYAEAGKDFHLCQMLIQPFIGIEADYFLRHRILEKDAGSLNLKVYSQERQKTFSRLGVHLTTESLPKNISLSVDLAWQYRLTTLKNQINEHFEEFGNQFVILGVAPSRNVFEAAATVSWNITDSIRLYAEFSGERWNRANAYSWLGGLETSW